MALSFDCDVHAWEPVRVRTDKLQGAVEAGRNMHRKSILDVLVCCRSGDAKNVPSRNVHPIREEEHLERGIRDRPTRVAILVIWHPRCTGLWKSRADMLFMLHLRGLPATNLRP